MNFDGKLRGDDVDVLTLALDSVQFDDCWTQQDLVNIHVEPILYVHITRQER